MEQARKQRLEKDSALCVMLSRDCDVVERVEDGIRRSTLSNGKCIPHLSNGYPTQWSAGTTPATCRGCHCSRKSEIEPPKESYMLFGKNLHDFASTEQRKVG